MFAALSRLWAWLTSVFGIRLAVSGSGQAQTVNDRSQAAAAGDGAIAVSAGEHSSINVNTGDAPRRGVRGPVKLDDVTEAHYMISDRETPRIWFHGTLRFYNEGDEVASIRTTRIILTDTDATAHELRVADTSSGQQLRYRSKRGGAVNYRVGPADCDSRMTGNDSVVSVAPGDLEEREVWATAEGTFEHEFRPVTVVVECVDTEGNESAGEYAVRHVAG